MDRVEDDDDDRVNGIDVDALSDVFRDVQRDPAKGMVAFRVKTVWQGRARSETTVQSCSIGGETVARNFTVVADQPEQLLGANSAINPQELLMAALNSCLVVSYVAGAAIKGVELESIEIETEGELDLRGFYGIGRDVSPGCETIRYTVFIKGDGTEQEFREIHETAMTTAPNFFNIARPVKLEPTLVVG
jgi:uncharacterized OsmC-like protein